MSIHWKLKCQLLYLTKDIESELTYIYNNLNIEGIELIFS